MKHHSGFKGTLKITVPAFMLCSGAALLFGGFWVGKKTVSGHVFAHGVCSDAAFRHAEASHEGHDEHGRHHSAGEGHCEAEHAAEGVIALRDSAIRQFGIEVAQAAAGTIGVHATFPAEIALNNDKTAHVVPRVPGVVRAVFKTLGDSVRTGEALAVIHSRELADFKAAYLAAGERLRLAEALLEREQRLWKEQISAEQDYLRAQRDAADARIEWRSAGQKLHALGFSADDLARLPDAPEESYIVYEITAPIDGVIIEKHITLGEMLRDDSEPFVIADLNDVWVNVRVHQKALPRIKRGQKAVLKTEHHRGEGIVSHVSRVVDENTRTALARIILPNDSGRWRPGTFATAEIAVEAFDASVVVPAESIVSMEGRSFVFLPVEAGYRAQEVRPGRMNGEYAEILSGLEPGQAYVARGAFTLKSEMTKSAGDPCGGH